MRLRLNAIRTGTAAQTPVGVGRRTVTVIPERRGESDFLYLFLGLVFLAACLRGMWHGEVVAFVLLPIPVAIFRFWIYMRMKPPFALTMGRTRSCGGGGATSGGR